MNNYFKNSKKHIIAAVFAVPISTVGLAQKPVELLSPDGNIKLSVTLSDKIYYTVSNSAGVLLQNNELQLHLRNETLGKNPKLSGQKRTSVDAEIKPVVPFKFSTVKNRYNQLLLNFKGNYSVEFRAFDDGIAHRFITRRKGEIEVVHEDVNLSFAGDYLLHVQLDGFNSRYEEPYKHLESRSLKPEDKTAVLPILIDTRKGVKILMSEADLSDYSNLFFHGRGDGNGLKSVLAPFPLETKADPGGRDIWVEKSSNKQQKIVICI